MNDVLTTLAVIAIIGLWAFLAYSWALLHMDIGVTRGWWIGQVILVVTASAAIYALIRWATTT